MATLLLVEMERSHRAPSVSYISCMQTGQYGHAPAVNSVTASKFPALRFPHRGGDFESLKHTFLGLPGA